MVFPSIGWLHILKILLLYLEIKANFTQNTPSQNHFEQSKPFSFHVEEQEKKKPKSYQDLDGSFYSLQFEKWARNHVVLGKQVHFRTGARWKKERFICSEARKLSGAGAQRKPADTRVPTAHLTPRRKTRMRR